MTKKLKSRVKSKEQTPALLDVQMDKVGKLANSYVDILDAQKELIERQETSAAELVDALKLQNRREISVRGITLRVKEIEAKIKISVQRKNEK